MEYHTETKTAIGKTPYDFRAFQTQFPQTYSSNEQEFREKGGPEMEAASYSTTDNHFTSVHGFRHNERLDYSSSTNQQNQYQMSSALTSSKVLSCRYSPEPAPGGSILTQGGSQPSVDSVYRVPVCSPSNRDIWSNAPYKDFFLTQARPSFSKHDNCFLVWCKSALQSTTQMLQNQGAAQLPQNTPRSEQIAERGQHQSRNPFENFTSTMKIPRHVFHPNEALNLQRYETRNGSASTAWNMNNGETPGSVDHRIESRFIPQLSAGTLDPNLAPYIPVPALNMAAQFSPFFEANTPPMMAWQCAPLQSPGNEPGTLNSFLPAAMRPKNTPVRYMLDPQLNVQKSRGMGSQAPFPLVTRATTPQYPDVKCMFRAANLLMMPNHVTQETRPLCKETPSEINNLSNVQKETPDQDETEAEKLKETAGKDQLKTKEAKSHRCNFCQKVYSRHSALKIHMRIHTGERPYSCSVCQRTFAQAGGLESHTRSHTGEKPFKCDVCDRRFSHSTAVRNHKRIHTGEKPFRCEQEGCGKAFADQSTLKKHRRIHTGEKPFQCPYCLRKFTQLGNMNKHIRCRHISTEK